MANVIKLKQGSGSNPQASDLVLGELAIRTDGTPKLFALNDAGNVVGLGGAPDDGSITSAKIADGAIVNADINASAAIDVSKLSGVMPSGGGVFTGDISTRTLTPASGITNADLGASTLKYRNIHLSGNIVVDGYVDNRDIAADGSKLDGIESGATADQSASEIVALIADQTIAPSTIDMEDNEIIKIGNSDDLQLHHNGNNSVIADVGQGELSLQTNGTGINCWNSDGGEYIARFIRNASCELYENGTKRFETTASGANINGSLSLSGTVDGVDIAARDTLFGGLTSSSGVLSNGVTATTQSAGDNSTKVATTAYTDTAISNLVDSSPSTLNTLNELAAALGDDANFSTTVTNSIATKLPLAGGTLTGALNITDNSATGLVLTRNSQTIKLDANYGNGGDQAVLASASLRFYTNGTSERVRILANGNVGISDTNPSSKLSVSGNITSTAHITGVSDSSDAAFIAKGDGSSQDGYIQLNCSQNSHGIKLASPAHSAAASYTFTFPSSIVNNGVLKTDGSANTSFGLIATANVADDAITYAKMQNTANGARLLGRLGSGGGQIQEQTKAEVLSFLNVEDGATADQSASEILTLIKTVDGAGSGLDADTLDGISSASFLRSDGNDTTTGNLTISKSGATLTLKDTTTTNTEHAIINFDDGNNQGVALKHVEHDGDLPVAGYGLVLTGSSANTQFPSTGTVSLTVLGNIYAGATTVGSVSRVLTTADEGSGNGLDADTLDGQHGSYYSNYNNLSNKPTIPTNNNQLTNGAGYITSAALAGASDGGNAALLDGIDSTQFLRSDADDTTSGTLGITSNSAYPLNINGNDNAKIVLQGSNDPYIRFREGTTDKAYIQWSASGHLQLVNQESGEYLRISSGINGLTYTADGTQRTVYHTGNLPTIPTNNNQLTNGAGYITSASFSDVAGGGTFSGDVTFNGGAAAVNIASASDIRLNSGSWTGNSGSVMKIQGHDNALYIVGGTNGIRFREDGTDRWFIDGSGHFIPASGNTYNIGSSSNRVNELFVNDMHFSNKGSENSVDGSWGDWTLQEGEEDIFMINNRSGKKFKIAMIPV